MGTATFDRHPPEENSAEQQAEPSDVESDTEGAASVAISSPSLIDAEIYMLMQDAQRYGLLVDAAHEGSYMAYSKFTEDEFQCTITTMNDLTSVELNIISHGRLLAAIFQDTYETRLRACANKPFITQPNLFHPCVARFYEDDMWYRAVIIEIVAADLVKVKYVDYGNIDVLPVRDLRSIDYDLTTIPPATVTAKLANIQINPETTEDDVKKQMKDVLFHKGPFNAKVTGYESLLPLVELKNDDNALVYQSLITNKTFIYNPPF